MPNLWPYQSEFPWSSTLDGTLTDQSRLWLNRLQKQLATGGTVTSVGLSMPAEFTVSGSPVTASGTLTATKANQNANSVYAGPASGTAAAPAFRALAQADMPSGIAPQVNSDWNAASGVAQILNKPTIPAAQVNSDWNASSGVAQILNKPVVPAVPVSVAQGGTGATTAPAGLSNLGGASLTAANTFSGAQQIISGPVSIANSTNAPRTGAALSVGSFLDLVAGSTNPSAVCSIRADGQNTVINGNGTGLVYLAYDKGTGGVIFGNGAGGQVGSISSGGAAQFNAGLQTHAGANGAYGANMHNFYWSGGVQCWIDTSNVGTIQMASDYRLKEDIEPLTSALPLLNKLRPVTFKWRDIENDIFRSDGVERHFGLIAHEAQAVAPELVMGEKDARTVDGKIQPQCMNILDMLALLIRAVQELSERVVALEGGEAI